MTFTHIAGPQGKQGLEYLGFCFDGKRVRVRDSTISRFYRKVAIAARSEAIKHIQKTGLTDATDLLNTFNFSQLSERFTRVRKTAFDGDDVRTWTFWTYLKRASKVFGADGGEILHQAAGYRRFVRCRVEVALNSYLSKPSHPSK